MERDFTRGVLGSIGTPVFRLGLSATYRPGKDAIYKALDEGVNYFFYFGIDTQMTRALRDVLRRDREKYVIATGAYNYIWWRQNLKRTLERRLRQLGADYIDVFHFLGVMKPAELTPQACEELAALREDPRVRGVAISTHDRKLAGRLAAEQTLDALMIRYNAAHRGAEQDLFPYLAERRPAVIGYTATRWRYLLRRPHGWPKDRPVPDAGMCYRFVLSNPDVDVCLTAPSNRRQLEENLAAIRKGPLAADEMRFMCEFGDVVYQRAGWFM